MESEVEEEREEMDLDTEGASQTWSGLGTSGWGQWFSNEPPLLSNTAAAVGDDSERAGSLG